MARPRYALAKLEAEKLLARAGVTRPEQLDVSALADLCGAEIFYAPYDDEGGVAGVLIRQPGKAPLIGVNERDREVRRRFTVAHELGHLLMHNDAYHVDTKIHMRNKDSSTAESIQEIEANQFAANLLMPARLLEKELDLDAVDVDQTAEDLAERYKVSIQAMTLRLAKLLKYGL